MASRKAELFLSVSMYWLISDLNSGSFIMASASLTADGSPSMLIASVNIAGFWVACRVCGCGCRFACMYRVCVGFDKLVSTAATG